MPAKKVTKKAADKESPAKKVVAKKVAAKNKPAVKKALSASKAPAKKAVAKKAATKSAVKISKTTIVVKYDVGIGNSMVLRGDGPGLSWETGTVMENTDSDTWQWSTSSAKSAFAVKFLINDAGWSQGENFVVKPGTTSGFSPSF